MCSNFLHMVHIRTHEPIRQTRIPPRSDYGLAHDHAFGNQQKERSVYRIMVYVFVQIY